MLDRYEAEASTYFFSLRLMKLFFFFIIYKLQLQLSPSLPGGLDRNGANGHLDDVDDEMMEMTEFYAGGNGGSQSMDCEASPPPLQVLLNIN